MEFALNKLPAVSKMLRGMSWHLIQGSRINSDDLNRLFGFTSISFNIRFLASLFIISGNFIWPRYILPYNSASLEPLNGKVPQRSAYSKTPRAHISTCLPSYSCFLTNSGAMYEGVPQKILSFYELEQKAAKPKSMTFIMFVLSSMSILSSLTSLCAMPRWCR